MTDHYFSDAPSGPGTRGRVTVTIAGREVDVATAGGVFSTDKIDLGTRVLLRSAPPPPSAGDLLDLGCGWGPLALTLASLAPAARVWAVDVNPRALELRFATIWSNPPIRVGKAALHDLLLRWLPRLAPGGTAYLVVQRHLGADSLHSWLAAELAGDGWEVARHGSAKGYRVLRVGRTLDG
jgi:16S rRNA (guanine1207-N2)-methyltransferase